MPKTVSVTLAFQKNDYNGKRPNVCERLIRWWTKSKYYHVEIILDNKWISSLDYMGVRVKQLRKLSPMYDYHTMDITVGTSTYANLLVWIDSQTGAKYDWYGLVMSQIFGFGIDHTDEWICSELVTEILQMLCVSEVKGLDPIMVSPGDLAKIFKVE